MATSTKTILAIAGAALTLGACASDPYYDGYNGYGYDGDRYAYGWDGGPAYYDPYYYGPAVGFGFAFADRDRFHEHRFRDRDHDHEEHHGHDRDGDQRG
jgi:hypothetical protein